MSGIYAGDTKVLSLDATFPQFKAIEKKFGSIIKGVLISAKILQGRKVTSTPGIKDDMENAGAIWINEPVVVDGHLVSSRRPPDLPPYAKAFADALA